MFPAETVWKAGAEQWRRLYEVEQAVGLLLYEPQLSTEFTTLLEMAKARGVQSVAVHQANAKLFEDRSNEAAVLARKRAVYGGTSRIGRRRLEASL